MRYFCCLKLSQGLACMLILCYALSTTELRGRFFDDGQVRELLLDRGLSCDIFIFYKPTQPNPKTQQQHQEKIPGMSNLESKEDASAGAKDGDNGSGRILAVFDASKVNKEENNSTTEMRLRAFLMFEWKKYTGKLVEDPTNETTGGTTPDSDGKFVQLEKDDATSSNASPSAGDEPIFPSGTQTYKISKFESVQPRDAMQVPDPFKKVSSRLCFFTAITIVQLLMLILHSCCKPGDDSKYSPCELLLTGFCFVIWVLAFCLAAEISYHWNSLWECTNFRPEKPPVFVLTAVLAMLIAILFLAELLAEEDLLAGGTTSAQMPVARRPEANNANSSNNNNQQPPKSNTNHVVAIPRHVHVYSPNNHQQQMVPSERKEFYTIAVRN